jgi:hypothetical protein
MSLTTLRIAMWLALCAALGCGFFMAYSLMFIAGFSFWCSWFSFLWSDPKMGRLPGEQHGDSSRKDTWKTK